VKLKSKMVTLMLKVKDLERRVAYGEQKMSPRIGDKGKYNFQMNSGGRGWMGFVRTNRSLNISKETKKK
jgi:hypothetical protein